MYVNADFTPIHDGFVELDDNGVVLKTGKSEDISSEKEYYDGAVVPGFVNAHCHLELSSMRGKFRKGTGMAGFIDQINELRDSTTHEQKLEEISYWMKTLWNRGVSAMADISNCSDTFAEKSTSPMYTRTFLEVFGTEPEDCDAVMDGVRELKKTADSFGIDAAPTPHARNMADEQSRITLMDIVDTPISPELIPADEQGNIKQVTEDLVGPYELHDFFLYYTLRFGFRPQKIYYLACKAFDGTGNGSCFTPEVILKWLRTFFRRFFTQQFKRSCLPDGPKVGSCSLSPRGDWRMPSDACSDAWLADLELDNENANAE